MKECVNPKEQTKSFYLIELHEVRQAIHPDHEYAAVKQLEEIYGKKYSLLMDNHKEVPCLLNKDEQNHMSHQFFIRTGTHRQSAGQIKRFRTIVQDKPV